MASNDNDLRGSRRSPSARSQPPQGYLSETPSVELIRELPAIVESDPPLPVTGREDGCLTGDEEAQQQTRPELLETNIDITFLEKVTNDVQRFSGGHQRRSSNCSIYKVPQILRERDEQAYTPQVVSIGPCHYKGPSSLDLSSPYKDTQDCKWRILDYFVSKSKYAHLEEGERTRKLMGESLHKMREHEATIKSYYSYEIAMDSNELALMMVLDGCFILYLLLETSLTPVEHYMVGRVHIRSEQVKYDLLLVENQIPFIIINELRNILGVGDAIDVNLVHMALDMLKEIGLPMNNSILIEDDHVLHLLDLFYKSRLPTSSSRRSMNPVWSIPCATELMENGITFESKDADKGLLDINFRKKGIMRRGVLEIPSLKLYDSTSNLFRNFLAYERCHPPAGFNITVYLAFMDSIIDTEKDVRMLHLNGILINCMTGYQELTHFFRWLCAGAYAAGDQFYLADVFADVTKYRENKWNVFLADFKRAYCSNKWAVFAGVLSTVFFLIGFLQLFYAIIAYYKPRN